MTEYKVWRAIVDWVEDNGGSVIAACPPGSSVYDYRKFCLIDATTGKRDEPDILLIWQKELYIIECKPTLRAACSKNLKNASDESDVEKLYRISAAYHAHSYDKQLLENYGVDVNSFTMKLGIGYATNEISREIIPQITQFIVLMNNSIKIVG